MTFANEELRNLLVLIAKAPITGAEATTVALLLQKLNAALNAPPTEPPPAS